ncbi:hypothetical protein LLE87_37735, partial [Paenibacillus polymyxa]|nr:hypothetical protein [Paenibacillus polymyxa]
GLVRVEDVLGNPEPEQGAHTMQKVVSVATTHDTVAREQISLHTNDRSIVASRGQKHIVGLHQ